uniref:Uncharacterized protein n=1 Tax=Anguilla anguilla TaxID=7936 RepID=A0A0E9QYJ6_ANGAN
MQRLTVTLSGNAKKNHHHCHSNSSGTFHRDRLLIAVQWLRESHSVCTTCCHPAYQPEDQLLLHRRWEKIRQPR